MCSIMSKRYCGLLSINQADMAWFQLSLNLFLISYIVMEGSHYYAFCSLDSRGYIHACSIPVFWTVLLDDYKKIIPYLYLYFLAEIWSVLVIVRIEIPYFLNYPCSLFNQDIQDGLLLGPCVEYACLVPKGSFYVVVVKTVQEVFIIKDICQIASFF